MRSYSPLLPNDALPQLPPAATVETVRTLKAAVNAHQALAELRTACDLIPNPALLVRAIVLQEARLSSEIENIITTDDELYQAIEGRAESDDPAIKVVLRYEAAIWFGYNALREGRPFSARLLAEIGQTIRQDEVGIRQRPGVRVVNRRTGEVIYAPPEGAERIRDLLDNLVQFLVRYEEMDPLIRMAIGHYQFEAIHPFLDGNGRTGRIANILFLTKVDLLRLPVLYLSSYLIEHRTAYYAGLRQVTEQHAWEDWVVFLLRGVEVTARDTKEKILAIRDAIADASTVARVGMRRGYSRELIETVFALPYTRIANLESRGIARRDAASAYLRDLERLGLLESVRHGRDVLYVNRRLLALLK